MIIINERLLLKLEKRYKRTIYDDGTYIIKISTKNISKCISKDIKDKSFQLLDIKAYSRLTGLIIVGNIDKLLKAKKIKAKKIKNKSARFQCNKGLKCLK